MKHGDLVKILEGDISLIHQMNMQDMALPENDVYVKPHYVKKMLLGYLAGKINSSNLTCWAMFICMRLEYGNEYYLNDDLVDYYENMFYVIQRLSTPEIDGEVNIESVNKYLDELKKYKD
jgi:hypothetical protein